MPRNNNDCFYNGQRIRIKNVYSDTVQWEEICVWNADINKFVYKQDHYKTLQQWYVQMWRKHGSVGAKRTCWQVCQKQLDNGVWKCCNKPINKSVSNKPLSKSNKSLPQEPLPQKPLPQEPLSKEPLSKEPLSKEPLFCNSIFDKEEQQLLLLNKEHQYQIETHQIQIETHQIQIDARQKQIDINNIRIKEIQTAKKLEIDKLKQQMQDIQDKFKQQMQDIQDKLNLLEGNSNNNNKEALNKLDNEEALQKLNNKEALRKLDNEVFDYLYDNNKTTELSQRISHIAERLVLDDLKQQGFNVLFANDNGKRKPSHDLEIHQPNKPVVKIEVKGRCGKWGIMTGQKHYVKTDFDLLAYFHYDKMGDLSTAKLWYFPVEALMHDNGTLFTKVPDEALKIYCNDTVQQDLLRRYF